MRRAQRKKSYHQRNYGNKQQRFYGYKAKFFKFKPEPTLKYSVANVVTNGWLNIEDNEHMINQVKFKSSLSVLLFNRTV